MNKEMKSKVNIMVKRGWWLRVVALSLIVLSSVAVTVARPNSPTRPALSGCTDTKVCLQQIKEKISQLRAYVRHVKPGDPVKFNPQPDPPGDPDPWYRQGLEAYKSLQAEIPNLSESSPWGRYKWSWSQEKIKTWQSTASEAQDILSRLGQATDRNAANTALNNLSASVQRLSKMLNSRAR
jgi:uncharacterized protein YukE